MIFSDEGANTIICTYLRRPAAAVKAKYLEGGREEGRERARDNKFYLAIVASPIDCAHYVLCMSFLLMRTTGLVRVGRGRQQHMSKLHDNADARRARGMCS